MTEKKTGYPSIDKPWQKYYSNEAISSSLPDMSMYAYILERNKDSLDDIALNYCNRNITYRELFRNIDLVADALSASGIKKGDRVGVCVLTSPEAIYLLYAINKIGAINVLLGFTSLVADLHEQIISTNCKEVFCVEMAYSKIVEATSGTNVKRIVSIPLEYSMPFFYRIAVGAKM